MYGSTIALMAGIFRRAHGHGLVAARRGDHPPAARRAFGSRPSTISPR